MRFSPHHARRLLFVFPLLVGLSAGYAEAEPLFEFCNDLWKCKCCREQRDPFEERIETERHDFTQSAVTVGRGVVQIEGGYSFFYKDEEEIEKAHTGPEMMLRFGLSEDIEFRVRWNYAWLFPEHEETRTGAEDLRWAFKLQMNRQAHGSLRPTSAMELRFTAPTAGEAWTTNRVEFGMDYIYLWELKEGVTLAGSTGFGTDGLGDFGLVPPEPTSDRYTAFSQSAVLGRELTERSTAYAEWFGIFSRGLEDEFVVSVFNIGVDYYLSDNVVIDFRAGKGLSHDSDDFFVGVGGGLRF